MGFAQSTSLHPHILILLPCIKKYSLLAIFGPRFSLPPLYFPPSILPMSTSFPPLSINTGYNGNSSGSLSPRIAPSSPGGALSRDIERQLRKDPKKWLEYLGAQNKLKAKQQHVQLEQLKEQLMNDPEELRKLQREAS